MKQFLIALVLIAVGSVLAHMHVVSQIYHPVTRIASPDGLVFTTVQNPTQERRKCGAANDRFLGPIKQQCTQCKVVLARCERELEPFELLVFEGKALADYQVAAPGMRMAITGPPELAKAGCEMIAGALMRGGHRSVVCLHPKTEQRAAPGAQREKAG